jgi:hypothetical protein
VCPLPEPCDPCWDLVRADERGTDVKDGDTWQAPRRLGDHERARQSWFAAARGFAQPWALESPPPSDKCIAFHGTSIRRRSHPGVAPQNLCVATSHWFGFVARRGDVTLVTPATILMDAAQSTPWWSDRIRPLTVAERADPQEQKAVEPLFVVLARIGSKSASTTGLRRMHHLVPACPRTSRKTWRTNFRHRADEPRRRLMRPSSSDGPT